MTPTTPTAKQWFPFTKSDSGADLRLFCFPYAGGGAYLYRRWSERFPQFVQVVPVELPGRGGRLAEPGFTNMVELVPVVGEVIRDYLNGRPFALFGHSLGAMISFEVARYLRREHGLLPAHLFVAGRRAPRVPENHPPTYALPEDEFIEELRNLKGTPEEVLNTPELMKLMIPLLRADFEVVQTYAYVPEPPLQCSITAFGGLEDSEDLRDMIELWREETLGRFTLRMLPGDHFFVRTSEPLLTRLVAQELTQIVHSI